MRGIRWQRRTARPETPRRVESPSAGGPSAVRVGASDDAAANLLDDPAAPPADGERAAAAPTDGEGAVGEQGSAAEESEPAIGGGDGDEPADGGGDSADSEIEGGLNKEILYHLLELIVPSIHPLPH